jgi:ribosomal protein RSM22 (predicted rRNA methylase)
MYLLTYPTTSFHTLGKILRQTIPKSQGKQPFYDARKSSWGDLFPHAPKNKPQERHFGGAGSLGQDIGKRSGRKAGKAGIDAGEAARRMAAKVEKEAQTARKTMRRERKRLEKEAEERQI